MTDDANKKEYEANITEDGGDVTIEATIPVDVVENYRESALDRIRKEVSLDGFRDEKIPADVLEERVGEMNILQEMAGQAVQDIYPKIIADNEIQAIGRPDVKITKIAPDSPVAFTAEATTMPEVTLPDNIAEVAKKGLEEAEKTEEEGEVTEEDVDEAIDNIRRQWAQSQKRAEMEEGGMDPEDLEASEEDLPEIDDEFVKKISNDETVEEFRATLKENIAEQNKRKASEAKRGRVIQAVVDASTADLPDLVVEGELDKMMAQFESDVTRSGMDMEEYFEQADTTREEMREKWLPDAKRRAKTQLVLNKIAAQEDIHPDEEAVESEVEQVVENYEDVDEARARTFVKSRLTNEKTIEYLEELAEE